MLGALLHSIVFSDNNSVPLRVAGMTVPFQDPLKLRHSHQTGGKLERRVRSRFHDPRSTHEDELKWKNVRQTEVLVDLKQAILMVSIALARARMLLVLLRLIRCFVQLDLPELVSSCSWNT